MQKYDFRRDGSTACDYTASLQTPGSGKSVQLVETEVLEEMKSRLELVECQRPPTPCNLCTLRVKAEDGEQV